MVSAREHGHRAISIGMVFHRILRYSGVAGMSCSLAILVIACHVERERPTGLSTDLPRTSVQVIHPEIDAVVPADSAIVVIVEATGLLQAVEYRMLNGTGDDTLDATRQTLETPVERIEASFMAPIPAFITGERVQFVGIAENVVGERTTSTPVSVIIIECERFELACANP